MFKSYLSNIKKWLKHRRRISNHRKAIHKLFEARSNIRKACYCLYEARDLDEARFGPDINFILDTYLYRASSKIVTAGFNKDDLD